VSASYFAGSAWATGFMIALHENSSGLGSRSASARSAVEGIARFASLRSTTAAAMASVSAELSAHVAKLMDERLFRREDGPLLLCLSGGARGGKPRHVPRLQVGDLTMEEDDGEYGVRGSESSTGAA
jgi:hypothetical protein